MSRSEEIVTPPDALVKTEAERDALAARLAEDNAVCLCGCPLSEHEDNGEDGEQCEVEDHVCLRTYAAIMQIYVAQRAVRVAAEQGREAAESRLARAEEDIAFLAPRAFKDGEWYADEERDFGLSANNLVNVAYGAKDAGNRPYDIWDMRACERAYVKLPAHRMTEEVRLLLVACRAALAPGEKEENRG